MRRSLRPPRSLHPTRAGWNFFVITFCVGFAALNTGNNLLYLVLSLMLAFVVLSGVLSESALRGIEIRRRPPDEAYADAPASVVVEIHNSLKRFPSFALLIEDCEAPEPGSRIEFGAGVGRVFALRVGAGETEQRRYSLRAEKRGRLELAGFRITTRFPFGLFLKSRAIRVPGEILVYPAIEAVAAIPNRGARARSSEGAREGVRSTLGTEASGLREWTRSDSIRRVHWKASLRRDQWQVVELDDERDAQIEVHLRTAGAGIEPERFERNVSFAASEIVAHLEAGLRVSLTTDDESIPADSGRRHRKRLLSYLATVAPQPPERSSSPPRVAA